MAKKQPAAPAQQHPHAYPYAHHPDLRLNDVVDALDDLDLHLAALEAAEQLMAPQKLGIPEDLAHVNREGLAFMFTLLNCAVREKFAVAKARADKAYELNFNQT